MSDDLRGAADLLIRAHSLYSQAEMTARRMFTELLQAGTQAKPGYAAVGVAAVAAGGFLAGWTIDGKPNSAWMSTFTYPFQEGVLSGAGGIIGGVPIGKSIAHTDEVNKAAGKIANFSGPAKDVVQGNHLTCARCRRMPTLSAQADRWPSQWRICAGSPKSGSAKSS